MPDAGPWLTRLAAGLLAGTSMASEGWAADAAGVAAAVKGKVTRAQGADSQAVASGNAMFMGDQVTAGAQSGMQILLRDETTFTVSPDSSLVIDEFVYDPNAGSAKLVATVAAGSIRYVSGQVAKLGGGAELKTPIATAGIRGSGAYGTYDPVTRLAAFLLTDPGPRNNTGDAASQMTVTGAGGSVNVNRSGFGVLIGADGVPKIFKIDLARLQQLVQQPSAAQKSGGNGGGVGDPNSTSGQFEQDTLITLILSLATVETAQNPTNNNTAQQTQSAATTAATGFLKTAALSGSNFTGSFTANGIKLVSGTPPGGSLNAIFNNPDLVASNAAAFAAASSVGSYTSTIALTQSGSSISIGSWSFSSTVNFGSGNNTLTNVAFTTKTFGTSDAGFAHILGSVSVNFPVQEATGTVQGGLLFKADGKVVPLAAFSVGGNNGFSQGDPIAKN